MTRVSLEEQYNNKDVITQILKMRDDIARIAANAAGIQDITLTTTATGWKFTFTLTDGTSYVFPMDTTGYITDAELAVALANYYTKTEIDNAFANYYTKTETDTALSAKAADDAVVKLTGNQTVDGTKTFNASPVVPTEPDGNTGSVNKFYVNDSTGTYDNNIVHKDANELISGIKTIQNGYFCGMSRLITTRFSSNTDYIIGRLKDENTTHIVYYRLIESIRCVTGRLDITTNDGAVSITNYTISDDGSSTYTLKLGCACNTVIDGDTTTYEYYLTASTSRNNDLMALEIMNYSIGNGLLRNIIFTGATTPMPNTYVNTDVVV